MAEEREDTQARRKKERGVDDSGELGPEGATDEATQSDMGLTAGGGSEAAEGERVGAEDEETPPEQR